MLCGKQSINYNNKKYYCFTVSIPENVKQQKVNNRTIIVIDVSGSMCASADNPTATEKTNLSVLDIVKHTAKTIVNVQDSNDELAIITYSNDAIIVLNLTKMTTEGKDKALKALNSIRANGMTNIYDGIKKAYDLIQQFPNNNLNSTIMLLSDGVPNIEPPRGTYLQFKKDVEDASVTCPRINTFGFGYGVEVNVLKNLSTVSQGSFGFIPDSNFVGTVIVNSLANTMCTAYNNTELSIMIPIKDYNVLGNYNIQKTSWGVKIIIGEVNFGQPRHFIIETPIDTIINNDDIKLISTNINTNITSDYQFVNDNIDETKVLQNIFRLKGVELLSELRPDNESLILVKEFIKNMENKNFNKQINGLIQDFNGQVLEAISTPDAYKKWGEKYLPSLACAYQLEECNNFKDFGVQFYGGELFKKLQTKCEDIFISIPPPVPETPVYRGYTTPVAYATPVSMSTFYDRSGACFHGDSYVLMTESNYKKISTIKKGDLTNSGIVECVVRTKTFNNKMQYCRTNKNLLITKYHPMILNEKFVFPVDYYSTEIVDSDYMYSLILEKVNGERPNTININDTECVTLGHGILNDPVASHQFFGTEAVINTLKCASGWNDGLITLKAGFELFTRDDKTQVVNNINLEYEVI